MAKGQESTVKNYNSKRRGLVRWCQGWSVDPCVVTVSDVADFLNYLHVHKYNTSGSIEGFRTAISHTMKVTCGLDVGKSSHLSSLISNFQLDVPRRGDRAPEWDVFSVTNHI